MAGLLVSVRSVAEARAAAEGGAAVVDVKEPARGPLGMADPGLWPAVRAALPLHLPLSVALGELREREGAPPPPPVAWAGVRWRKLGLSGVGGDPRWADRWAALRAEWGPGPAWIAVAYADWRGAVAPPPEAIIDVAAAHGCAGLLVDTWRKAPAPARPRPLGRRQAAAWVERARAAGLLVALAGGLDDSALAELAPLAPDLFAVRGAACAGGDRTATIDPARVASLVRLAAGRGL